MDMPYNVEPNNFPCGHDINRKTEKYGIPNY